MKSAWFRVGRRITLRRRASVQPGDPLGGTKCRESQVFHERLGNSLGKLGKMMISEGFWMIYDVYGSFNIDNLLFMVGKATSSTRINFAPTIGIYG